MSIEKEFLAEECGVCESEVYNSLSPEELCFHIIVSIWFTDSANDTWCIQTCKKCGYENTFIDNPCDE